MRILTVVGNLERGGLQRAAQNFALAYRRAGHDSAVAAYESGGVRKDRLEASGLQVFVAGRDTDRLARWADAWAPDLVHIHRPGAGNTLEAAVLAALARPHRRVLETNVFARVDPSPAADLVDVHLQLSQWCMWKWRRWLGPRRRRVAGAVVPYPVEPADFDKAPADQALDWRRRNDIPGGAYLCGRVGQPIAAKWHPQNVRAFAAVAAEDPDAHLVLRGLPDALRRDVDALPDGARRRVRLLDPVDDDRELSAMYSALDCFLHAALIGESFGLVLCEAMLCGCPVVTASRPARDNSQVEVVGHRQGGLVAGSVKWMGRAALELRRDPALAARVRATARARVIDRYGADRVAALAARVGALALACKSRPELIDRLAREPGLVTDVPDARVAELMRDTVGPPAPFELLQKRLVHIPAAQWAVRKLRALRR